MHLSHIPSAIFDRFGLSESEDFCFLNHAMRVCLLRHPTESDPPGALPATAPADGSGEYHSRPDDARSFPPRRGATIRNGIGPRRMTHGNSVSGRDGPARTDAPP
ncbi:protein of unknown function [Nitrospira japonica]|uniref:Uncharacterized protein n=1 Tax=Nitrospira japonica TaxID=1325564 RepID=A0A1W1I757_9BACT|nr:protein of unknown function [Nitrospira japonica]